MAEHIQDGRGNAHYLVVNPDGSINVSGVSVTVGAITGSVAITTDPVPVSGTLTANVGSESFMYAQSGAAWNALQSDAEGHLTTNFHSVVPELGSTGNILSNSETTVVEHTISTGSTYKMTGFDSTGGADACFRLYHNGNLRLVMRNNPAQRNVEKTFPYPLDFKTGSVVLTAEHQNSNSQNYYGTLYGREMG